ncbi:MAG: NAD(P)H-dependent glycerol-3-phosphate dehydrogenase [Pseudomonadota bacterium]
MKTITVIGAGSWGTALAEVQARLGHKVFLWDKDTDILADIAKTRQNRRYHPGHRLSKNVIVESDLRRPVHRSDLVVLAVPSFSIRDALTKVAPCLKTDAIVVSTAKGIETETLETPSAVALEVLGKKETTRRYAVLSGPSFAHEVIRSLPTAVTVAAFDRKTAKRVQDLCHTDTFQIYTSDDVIGVELAGALKNVIAIAAGAIDGLGFGFNARAALITRGLAEILRIGVKKGANPLTFSGLSGLGDLFLTCTGDLSRNRRVGLKLAQGKSLRVALKEVRQVVEGIRTAKAAYRLARTLRVDAPIIEETYLTLHEGKSLAQAIKDLLARAPEAERH